MIWSTLPRKIKKTRASIPPPKNGIMIQKWWRCRLIISTWRISSLCKMYHDWARGRVCLILSHPYNVLVSLYHFDETQIQFKYNTIWIGRWIPRPFETRKAKPTNDDDWPSIKHFWNSVTKIIELEIYKKYMFYWCNGHWKDLERLLSQEKQKSINYIYKCTDRYISYISHGSLKLVLANRHSRPILLLPSCSSSSWDSYMKKKIKHGKLTPIQQAGPLPWLLSLSLVREER